MTDYETAARNELHRWQKEMQREPGLLNQAARRLQYKLNELIPEKVHSTVTTVIEQMTRAVLTGSNYTAPAPLLQATLAEREKLVAQKIDRYGTTAAVEGGITGAGGILLGLADFPLLITIKLKLLFDVASLYGYSGAQYQERLYILHIFQLAFSSDAHRGQIYRQLVDWQERSAQLPGSMDDFDWRSFQQEYRNYIDLAKLAQLLPIVGAPVGVIVNHRLMKKLGDTAINAYRMRWFAQPRAEAPTQQPAALSVEQLRETPAPPR